MREIFPSKYSGFIIFRFKIRVSSQNHHLYEFYSLLLQIKTYKPCMFQNAWMDMEMYKLPVCFRRKRSVLDTTEINKDVEVINNQSLVHPYIRIFN